MKNEKNDADACIYQKFFVTLQRIMNIVYDEAQYKYQ